MKDGARFKVDIDTKLLDRLSTQAKNRAKTEIGLNAQGIMQNAAPFKTGALRNSINWRTQQEQGDGELPLDPVANPDSVIVGSNIVYAAKNEYEYGNSFARVSIPQIERDSKRIIDDNYKRQLSEAGV